MNEARLLAHYERIADAPDAVERLRRFVLDLAVRGKLVQQDPKDRPASDMLKQVALERARLTSTGQMRKSRTVVPIKDDVRPFPIAISWEFVRLGDVLEMFNGRAFKPTDWRASGLPIVRIQNLNDESAAFNYCEPNAVEDRHLIRDGDFLISWSGTPGTSFGAFIWRRGIAALNQHIFRCIQIGGAYLSEFLRLAINSQLDVLIAQAQGGVGLQHVTKGTLEALPLPLPPVSEQHRIVARVDELMALCSRLETARAEREATRDRLTIASLARLNAPDPETFQDDARFVLNVLPALVARPDQIKRLRQTILNLAVRGKLVPQDPNDEPASDLLGQLKRELRRRPEKNGLVRELRGAKMPFESPDRWSWTTVQQILDPDREISYGVIKLGDEPRAGGIPTLRCSDVRPGFIDRANIRKVHESIEAEYARTRLSGGEVVINIRGTLGGVALVGDEFKGFNVAREVAVVPIATKIYGPYVVHVMLSPFFWSHIQSNLRGIAYMGLNLGILRDLPIPLPPLSEQHRIVAKVDEVMALCDQLEASLTDATATRRRLLDALIAEVLPLG